MALTWWKYKRTIAIDNSNNSNALTDYQVKIDLDNSNFDFSKAKSDWSDIRFLDSDDSTSLDYWIEKWDSANNQAVVWAKVPDIPASSIYDIYMYYWNNNATSESNWDNTFDYFDDFESYASNTDINGQDGWTTKRIGGSGEAKVKVWNGRNHLHLNSTNAATAVIHPFNSSNTGYILRAYVVADDWNEAFSLAFTDDQVTSGGNVYNGYEGVVWGWQGVQTKMRKWTNGNATDLASMSDSNQNNVYYKIELRWINDNLYLWRDGNVILNATDTTYTSRSYIHLDEWTGTSRYIDYVLTRKYTSSEPTTAVGVEQQLQNAIFYSFNF